MNAKSLTIGHLAKEAGVNLETVRYYERRGLLPKPPRSLSGYRLYPADTARRLCGRNILEWSHKETQLSVLKAGSFLSFGRNKRLT